MGTALPLPLIHGHVNSTIPLSRRCPADFPPLPTNAGRRAWLRGKAAAGTCGKAKRTAAPRDFLPHH